MFHGMGKHPETGPVIGTLGPAHKQVIIDPGAFLAAVDPALVTLGAPGFGTRLAGDRGE